MLSPELLKKIQHIYIRSRYLADDIFSGEYETAFRGRGMEFEEVREYMPGDDIRTIDWNVSARMDRPYIKVFREEREQTVMLMVDSSASHNFGSRKRLKRDLSAEIAAVLAFAAVKSNDKVGLVVFSEDVERYIPPKKGSRHVWRVISEILSHRPRGKKTDMQKAINFFNKVMHKRSVCFVVSDYLAEGYETPLSIAGFKHDVIAVKVSDPLEECFPVGGLLSFSDLETGNIVSVDFSRRSVRDFFHSRQEKESVRMSRQFRLIGVDFLSLKTDENYIEPLLKFFRLREKKI